MPDRRTAALSAGLIFTYGIDLMGDLTVPVLSGLAGVLLAVMSFAAAQWRQRRETLDKRVEREVEAQLGRRYVDFLSAGQETNAALRETSEGVRAEAARIMQEAREHLAQLGGASETREALEESLRRAEAIIPDISVFNAATPPSLAARLRRGGASPAETAAIIERLRHSPGARSRHLELCGDAAKSVLGDYDLARDLYAAAVEKDPQSFSARAESLGLDLESSNPEVVDVAETSLLEMSRDRIEGGNALTILVNYDISSGQFEKMARGCTSLIDTDPSRAALHRNLAIALSESGKDPTLVIRSYEEALRLADATDSISDYVNTAKAYAPWLCRKGRFERAKEVLDRAVLLAPDHAEVYAALSTYGVFIDDLELASRAAHLTVLNGDSSRAALAEDHVRSVRSLGLLRGIDLGGDLAGDVGADARGGFLGVPHPA